MVLLFVAGCWGSGVVGQWSVDVGEVVLLVVCRCWMSDVFVWWMLKKSFFWWSVAVG